ncbi:MAG: glutaredoxin family protein [Gammaproteobacteria bacterium]
MAERVTVLSRTGCHLCEDLIAELEPFCGRRSVGLDVVDVDSDPELASRYGQRIPVVLVDRREVCEVRLDEEALLRALGGH